MLLASWIAIFLCASYPTALPTDPVSPAPRSTVDLTVAPPALVASVAAPLPTMVISATPMMPVASAAPLPTITTSPSSTPAPKPRTLAVEREVYERFRPALVAISTRYPGLAIVPYARPGRGNQLGKTASDVLKDTDPALRAADWFVHWAAQGGDAAVLLREEPYALAVHPLSARNGCTAEQLRALAGPDATGEMVVADAGEAAYELLGQKPVQARIVPAEDWRSAKEYVATHENAWALLPWEAVDFRVRVLPISGQRLDPRALQGYPLMRRLWLSAASGISSTPQEAPPELVAALRQALRYEPPATVELAAVGDIMLDRLAKEGMRLHGLLYPFEGQGIQPVLSQADITFGNLECALSDRGVPQPKTYQFRAEPQAAKALAYAGMDVLSLANNHTGDYGDLALYDTLQLLTQAGLSPVGAGRTITEAHQAVVVQANGLRIAFLAYNEIPPLSFAASDTRPGCAFMDRQRMVADVRAARQRADLVVVSCHWGLEDTPNITAAQREFANLLGGAGADLVIGHHPHVVQSLEYGSRTFTAYSLGNFVFDMGPPEQRWEGLILRCLLDASGVKTVELLPTLIIAYRPTLMSPDGGERILEHVRRLTRERGGYPRE